MFKNCVVCGKEFTPHGSRQKTCSKECCVKVASKSRSERRKAERKRMAAMGIQYDYYHVQQKQVKPKKQRKPRVVKTPPKVTAEITPPARTPLDEGLTPAQIAQRDRLREQLLLRRLINEFGADAVAEGY